MFRDFAARKEEAHILEVLLSIAHLDWFHSPTIEHRDMPPDLSK